MARANRFAELFNVKAGEGRLVVLLLIYSMFIGVAVDYFFIASSATFVDNFDASVFPLVMMAAGVAMLVTRTVYGFAERFFTQSQMLIGSMVFVILLVLLVRAGLAVFDGPQFAFTLLVWMPVVNRLTFWGFWGLANRLFNIGQGKRLFGLIGGGLVIASISDAFTVPLVTNVFGTENMYFISAAALTLCLLMASTILIQFRGQLAQSERPKEDTTSPNGEPQRPNLLRNRYVMLLLLLFILTRGSNYFIDYAQLGRLQEGIGDQDAIAEFIGVAFGVTAIFQMLFRFVLSGRLMTRYGVRVGLLALPIAFTLMNLGSLAVGLITGVAGMGAFFWFVIFTKYSEETLREGLNDGATRVLYQPLPASLRSTALVLVEGYGSPITAWLAGSILIFFWLTGSFTALSGVYLMLASGAAWIVVAVLTYREYVKTLQTSLEDRSLSGDALVTDDASTIELLTGKLKSANANEVIYAMDLLERIDTSKIVDNLEPLLRHDSKLVRQEALIRIEKYKPQVNPMLLLTMIRWEKNPDVKEYSLRALIAVDEENGYEILTQHLDDKAIAARRGAMVGLLRYGGIEGVLAAGQRLLKMNEAENPEDRMIAAQVLGDVGIRNFYQPLIPLLKDENTEVRIAALEAAGKIGHPALWYTVMRELKTPYSRAAARKALISGGEDVLPVIEHGLMQRSADHDVLVQLIRIAGRIGNERIKTQLADMMTYPDGRIRTQILKALTALNYRAGDEQAVLKQVNFEVEQAVWLLAAVVNIGDDETVHLLSESLHNEIRYAVERVLLLLALIYDPQPILNAYHALTYGNDTMRAYALELVDNLLSQEMKRLVIPLLDDLTDVNRLQKLASIYPQERMTRDERLKVIVDDVIESGEATLPTWIKAAAIYTVGRLKADHCRQAVEYALNSTDPIIVEAAQQTHLALTSGTPLPSPLAKGHSDMLSTIEKIIILKTVSLFMETPNDVLADVARILREVNLKAGETVIEEGDLGTSMYVIVSGKVRVHAGDQTLNFLSERSVFGEMALLDPEPRVASVTAVEDTKLFRLDQAPFYELMADYPAISRGIIQVLMQNLRARAKEVVELKRVLEAPTQSRQDMGI